MESLGELLKRTPMGSEALRRSAELMDGLLADPLVERFRGKYPELDNNTIRLNLNRFYQYVKEYRNCERCPGLSNCPNDLEGHYTVLSCETISGEVQLYDRKASCKKFIARQNDERIRGRIRSFYVDEKSMRNEYSAEEIILRDPTRSEAVGQLTMFIDRTKEQGLEPTGLYLEGRFGTGKTFLMCYLLHELAKAGYSGVIVYMPDFVEDLKAMMHEPGKLKETVDMMKETDLLIFDDIGAENLSPWVRDHVMGGILNYRMERKPTFYTSNLDLDALEQHFSFTSKEGDERHKGERIMERIRPYVNVIRVTGANQRKR
jgi:primosomal protein DnaI